MTKMKALVKAKAERGIWLQEVEKPVPSVNEVLIKIRKTAICGTDIHIYRWDNWAQKTIKVPMVIGHEYVGVIEDMGSGVVGFEVGERVTGEGHIACGKCRNCRRGRKHICENTIGVGVNRDGAFAEYVAIPSENVMRVDSTIPDEIVSIMDPFGNATHTALSFPLVGEDVLVTGAGGPIGAMCVAISTYAGARKVVALETNEYRGKLAEKMGAKRVVNPLKEDLTEVMKDLHMLAGFDIGLECSGAAPAFNQMIDCMYNGSKISLLGILPYDTNVEWSKIIFKGLTLKGIYGREMFETWYKMEQMLLSGLDISGIITHRFGINDYLEAFDIMDKGNSGKIILDWQ